LHIRGQDVRISHMDYMEEAISLARKAIGNVSPNPAVGAVIVKDNEIVGRGYTQPPGGDHAEVVALKQAGELARGASLYVTLEPCCHFGRTPPCTQSIIKAGIREVHFSIIDPNPLVNGKGRDELQRNGIITVEGEKAKEAKEICEAYIKYITTGLPFITLKYAMSIDGKIATHTGESKWISGDTSRKYVHFLRYMSDAVLVGVNTVIKDNPQLTVRYKIESMIHEKQPVRIILDTFGRVPTDSQIFHQPGKTIVVYHKITEDSRLRLIRTGAELIEVPADNDMLDLNKTLEVLGKKGITSILVEGGATIFSSFFDNGLVDKVIAFIAPVIIGGSKAKSPIGGRGADKITEALRLNGVKITQFDNDVMISGYLK